MEHREEMSDFNPPVEAPADIVPRFGSMEQFQEVVFRYVKASLMESGLKLKEYNQDSVIGLLLQVSDEEDASPWWTWRSWMRRHLIPTLELTKDHSFDRELMRKRLIDLLGYIFMAFELVELSELESYDDAWNRFRSIGTKVQR